jgi:hypothetical protein
VIYFVGTELHFRFEVHFGGKDLHPDPSSARVQDFVSLTERESKEERHEGTLGNKIEF